MPTLETTARNAGIDAITALFDVGGAGDLDISGLFTWNSGTQQGAGETNANGNIALGASSKTLQRVLNNAATATWTAGNIFISTGASGDGVFNNLMGATFDAQGDDNIQWIGGSPVFNNIGTFLKSAGTMTTAVLSMPFNNNGTVGRLLTR